MTIKELKDTLEWVLTLIKAVDPDDPNAHMGIGRVQGMIEGTITRIENEGVTGED